MEKMEKSARVCKTSDDVFAETDLLERSLGPVTGTTLEGTEVEHVPVVLRSGATGSFHSGSAKGSFFGGLFGVTVVLKRGA